MPELKITANDIVRMNDDLFFVLPYKYDIKIEIEDGVAKMVYKEWFLPSLPQSAITRSIKIYEKLFDKLSDNFKNIRKLPKKGVEITIEGSIELVFDAISAEIMARSTLGRMTVLEVISMNLVKNIEAVNEK